MSKNGIENDRGEFFEVLTPAELAKRWNLPESWVYEHVRARAADPIPHLRLGKYVRFQWNSPALREWWSRRQSPRIRTA